MEDRNRRSGGRRRTYGEGSVDVHKKGAGLGSGPVGSQGGYAGRKSGSTPGGPGRQGTGGPGAGHGPAGGDRGYGGSSYGGGSYGGGSGSYGGGRRRRSPLITIIIIAMILLGGGGGLSQILGSGSDTETLTLNTDSSSSGTYDITGTGYGGSGGTGSGNGAGTAGSESYGTGNASGSSSGSSANPIYPHEPDNAVVTSAREKYTSMSGTDEDAVTMMVYMCGADLESKSGMATKDLMEMAAASTDNINLIVLTGGSSRWNNNVVSSSVHQIYRVRNGGLEQLDDNAGTGSMTDPSTLSSFIQYCSSNYPANRNILIFWDHGGGSVSGYGYDELNSRSGSMSLSGIDKALTDGGVKFDFVGFDACLMATAENALMLTDHADYLIASEESEPGIGWYYTNWVNTLNSQLDVSTVELGREIADDFVSECAKSCPGQKTTMSVTDLAEVQATVPEALKNFSSSTSDLIENREYSQVSTARNDVREFAASSHVDMVDLIDLAERMGTEEGTQLAEVLDSAVKYNRTSSNISHAGGLSIYFPYSSLKYVDTAVQNYEAIGMDDSYSRCIQEFAKLEASGQIAAGGSSAANPFPSLFGNYTGTSYGSSSGQTDLIGSLLSQFLSSDMSGISGLNSSNTGFLSGRAVTDTGSGLTDEDIVEYIAVNHFDAADLQWTLNEEGQHVLKLSDAQWDLVQDLELNLFVDDGSGYIDLGLDNVYDWDEDGNLIGDTDGTWLTIDGQIVAYYHLDTTEVQGSGGSAGDGGTDAGGASSVSNGESEDESDASDSGVVITGRVPALLDGDRVNLILVFDEDHPDGYIAGASPVYEDDTTETVSKNLTEISIGDELQFLCDYYDYDGNYQDSYYLGDPLTVEEEMPIRNLKINGTVSTMYRLTDIYHQEYWTPAIEN